MVKRIILYTILLYAGYNAFLLIVKPKVGKGAHQWQQNVIAAQAYVDEHQGVPYVLTGSSLTFRLQPEMLPDSFYNLSFGGGSMATGLEIIARSVKKPRAVFVEMNIPARTADENMLSGLFTPVIAPLRNYLPALKEKYQPVNVLSGWFSAKGGKGKSNTAERDSAERERLLQITAKEYDQSPDWKLIEANLPKLKLRLKELQAAGVKPILFLMPVHCRIRASKYYQELVPRLMREFPQGTYSWLPEADCRQYTYNDGVHLSYQGADAHSAWFLKQAKTVLPQP